MSLILCAPPKRTNGWKDEITRKVKVCKKENQYCDDCNKNSMTIDGVWSDDGELLKIYYMYCNSCSFEQFS